MEAGKVELSKESRQRPTLAAVVLTKNEETNIAACLERLKWEEELIVVDAESNDRTVEIAQSYTPFVYVRPWTGYGPQKNFAIEQSTAEWILIVDADERVGDELREEILRTVRADPPAEVTGFEIPRRNYFYRRWVRGGGMYPDYQLRLFRRAVGRYNNALLHERLSCDGRILRLVSPFDHHTAPTISHHVGKMTRYTALAAGEKLKTRSRVTWKDLAGNHLITIFKTYIFRGGFRDGVCGLIVAVFAGLHTFVKYARAWETLHVRNRGKGLGLP